MLFLKRCLLTSNFSQPHKASPLPREEALLSPTFPAPASHDTRELVSSRITLILLYSSFVSQWFWNWSWDHKAILLILPKLMVGAYIFILSESCICLFGMKPQLMDSCQGGELFKGSLMFDHQERVALDSLNLLSLTIIMTFVFAAQMVTGWSKEPLWTRSFFNTFRCLWERP